MLSSWSIKGSGLGEPLGLFREDGAGPESRQTSTLIE